ncbi:MAG: hypothetical protein ASUL_09524 [Candidatus Aramenus sulfurataquae]|uniref:DUF1874 domain-containing protein n=1 Tax=Candidatus Aramenus sulfurataquae TaxID=1326980 RepID=W7KJM6_9CREN|nr:MAG: hypothetical protein ASUL_09524 [Candidatus Aramenus sulfurataquae]
MSTPSKVYLLTTPGIFSSARELWVRYKEISPEEAKKIIEGRQVINAVSHPATVQLLSKVLGISLQPSRITVDMQPGDLAIAIKVQGRLPESGKELTEEELKSIGYKLYLLQVLTVLE